MDGFPRRLPPLRPYTRIPRAADGPRASSTSGDPEAESQLSSMVLTKWLDVVKAR